MNRAYASDEVREIIEDRLKTKRDEANRLFHAKVEGKVEVAKTLLSKGMPLNEVLELTGLTAEQLDHERFRSF